MKTMQQGYSLHSMVLSFQWKWRLRKIKKMAMRQRNHLLILSRSIEEVRKRIRKLDEGDAIRTHLFLSFDAPLSAKSDAEKTNGAGKRRKVGRERFPWLGSGVWILASLCPPHPLENLLGARRAFSNRYDEKGNEERGRGDSEGGI